MADVTSIHDILEKPGYTYEQIRTLLRRDSSSINQVLGGKAPLHRVLKGPSHGPASIVKLLLEYGANPNLRDYKQHSPLLMTLVRKDRLEVVRELVAAGARIHPRGELPLCTLRVFLDAQAEVGLVEMLIQAGADFNVDTSYERTPVYSAFQYKDKDDVERMKALLDSSGVDLKIRNPWNATVLHELIIGAYEPPLGFIEYLLDRGLDVDAVDDFGMTPMHEAAKRGWPSVVNLLLKRGASLYRRNNEGETTLSIAVSYRHGFHFIKLLLNCGAKVCPLALTNALENYNNQKTLETFETFLLLVKFCYLQYLDFAVSCVVRGHSLQDTLLNFGEACKHELRMMQKEDVGGGCVLFEFMHVFYASQMNNVDEKGSFDTDMILKILKVNKYPLFSGIISDKLSKTLLREKLAESTVYVCKEIQGPQGVIEKNISLNYDALIHMENFLDKSALLNLILAFQR
ncbi:hypothetical protein JTE90_014770 [Oedothorax gibbosus]|uniref:Ankyrin repeat protein n=1 Tax=Oedothorax gibbosus TaxID=931172 RepID=A0AAV6TGJ5_9ARAC|nr:hypothetical protein JTE90_014770 [Oedothorax gibbosus]